MEKLIVLEGNCGDEGQEYKKWLEKNLPNEVELDFRDGCCGVGGGLFDDEGNEMDNNIWWTAYCDSQERFGNKGIYIYVAIPSKSGQWF